MGRTAEDLAKSVFVEKLDARGYEVLLLGEPLDEIFVQNIRNWKCVSGLLLSLDDLYIGSNRKISFQDVAKAGLNFGDEGAHLCFT